MGGSSNWFAEDGRPFALAEDKATCGNCKGLWPIAGTALDCLDEGRAMVKDMARVYCPCRENFVYASGSSPFLWSEGGGTTETVQSSTPPQTYDEQISARAPRVSLEGYPYLIETADGQTVCGHVDSSGRLPRIYTRNAATYTIHWGDEALAHEEWQ
jgi:hypothetical protein